MPKYGVLEVSVEIGQQKSIELKVADQVVGLLNINREAQ